MLSPRDKNHLYIVRSERLKNIAHVSLNDWSVPANAYFVLLKALHDILVPEIFGVTSYKVYWLLSAIEVRTFLLEH